MDPESSVPLITPSQQQASRSLSYARTTGYCLAFMSFGLEVNLMGPTIPTLARRAGVAEADMGPLFTLTGLTCLIGAFPSGYLVDRMPGHVILGVAMLLQALGLALIPFCNSLMHIYVAYGMIAFTWNFVNTTGNTLVMWRSQKEGGALVNVIHAVFGVGSFCSPLLVELFRARLGSALAAYWCIAAFCAAVGLLFMCIPSPTNPHKAQQGQQQEGQDGGEGAAAAAAGAEVDGGGGGSAQGRLGSSAHWCAVVPVFVMIWWCVGTEVSYGGWIVSYALRYLGLREDVAESLNALYWFSFTVGRVVASLAAAFLPAATVLLLSLPLGLAGAALPLLAPFELLRTWGIYVATVLVGVGISTGFANSLALLSQHTAITGAMQGTISAFSGAGCMLLPLAVSLLAKHTPLGFQALMWLSLGAFVLMLSMVLVVKCCAGQRHSLRVADAGATEPLLQNGTSQQNGSGATSHA